MKILLLTQALLLLPFLLFSQSFTVRGVVRATADQVAIPGVSVQQKGTANGTITDSQGQFLIVTIGPNPRLVFCYIGYVAQEIAITKHEDSLTIFLKEDVKTLSEVVVVGYGEARRREVTGGVSVLPGKVAGVSIRGASSLSRAPSAAEKAIHQGPTAKSGILTAGEVNDFSKWKLWPDIAKKDLSEWQQRWQMSPLERYTAQVVTQEGFPVVGARVVLRDSQDSVIWQAQSDNTGKCELWNGLFADSESKQVASLQAEIDGKIYSVSRPSVFHNGINVINVNRACVALSGVDIAFVVDATGSMGDEIRYLQAELKDVIAQVKDSLSSATIHLGSVFYRDEGDEYVTRKTPLSTDIQSTVDFIRNQQADGGGDFPEAMDRALKVAIEELNWTEQAKARLLFLILDAPPHENPQVIASLQQLTRQASAKGIRIIPITASGIDKSTEYLMRAMALATNGTYVFLTDDSGVGNAHIKPTTDKYEVELLNSLLVKLIAKYTYTPDCQVQQANVISKSDTVSGNYSQVMDTLSATTTPALDGTTYTWKCFPNPTPDILHVEMEGEVKELFVTDVTGKILLRVVPVEKKALIRLGNFPSGIYFLKFFTGKKWEAGRFLVSRQ